MLPFLLYFWIGLIGNFHGGHTAEYYYQFDKGYLELKFVMEYEELLQFGLKKDCNLERTTALCTFLYLNEFSCVEINGLKIDFELQEAYTEYDHFIVHLKANTPSYSPKKIFISNLCFYEFDRDYKNRIIVDIAEVKRSYLLNINSNSIEVEFGR